MQLEFQKWGIKIFKILKITEIFSNMVKTITSKIHTHTHSYNYTKDYSSKISENQQRRENSKRQSEVNDILHTLKQTKI